MPTPTPLPPYEPLAHALASAWGRLERRLDHALAGARGIRFAEFRLLRVLYDAPEGRTRVDLAGAVGLTPSGVTRALQPLEKLRIVRTERSERDARLAIAALTPAGRELVEDGAGVVEDVLGSLVARTGKSSPTPADLLLVLAEE